MDNEQTEIKLRQCCCRLLACFMALTLLLGYFDNSLANSGERSAAGNNGPLLFQAVLSGANEVPPIDSPASGQAILTLSGDGSNLHYRIMVNNIDGISAAHIHVAPMGANGPVDHWLYDATGSNGPGGVFDAGHPISGTIGVTSTQVSDLLAGNFYINIHTSDFGGGELRGQIEPYSPPVDYNALLTGNQEAPPVESEGAGVTLFTLSMTDTLAYEISVTDIVSVTAAHIHMGKPGSNGGVVAWLYDSSGSNAPGGPLDAANSISGTVTLDAQGMLDLLTGYLYVNVHTSSYPSGELRGQIGGARIYRSHLSGVNEVPAVDSAASGQTIWVLSADGKSLLYRTMVNEIDNIDSAHIHLGEEGANGPVIFWLYDASGTNGPGGSFGPGAPIDGTIALTETHLFDLARGQYYINIHTSNVPSGELRGQLEPHDASGSMGALMSGANEVPAVNTDAGGFGRLHLNAVLNALHYQLGTDITSDVTAIHIHSGQSGENGPVARWLYDANGVNAVGGTFGPGNPIAGSLMLTASELVDLLTGYHYVNVHTSAYGSGEIRGQIGGAQLYQAILSGSNEVPPATTNATGNGILALSDNTTALHYRIRVSSIVSVTGVHIHQGMPDADGPVVHWLYDESGTNAPGGTFDAETPISGSIMLTGSHLIDLAKGNYYINVHTSAMPSGEIRGQIEGADRSGPRRAGLSGANEVPPVVTEASGIGSFYLNTRLNTLHYQLGVQNIGDISAAHIHTGAEGANGPVSYWLYDANGANAPGGAFDPDNPIAGCLTLDAANLVDTLTGYHYVNIHTASVGSGELRSQISDIELPKLYLPTLFAQ